MRLARAERNLDDTRLFEAATGARLMACEREVLNADVRLVGTGSTHEPFKMIDRPMEFRNAITAS